MADLAFGVRAEIIGKLAMGMQPDSNAAGR
jgi:hypothetical protein